MLLNMAILRPAYDDIAKLRFIGEIISKGSGWRTVRVEQRVNGGWPVVAGTSELLITPTEMQNHFSAAEHNGGE